MNRYALRRLALIPVVLVLANFLGFAYAHLARPGQLPRTLIWLRRPDLRLCGRRSGQ